ncbi:hypothetical protein GCM10023324_11960 [Streptomyces youssoufiensis]
MVDYHTLGCDSLRVMDTKPWRERVRLEEELLEQLREQMSQAAARRAEALAEGKAELGSVYKVAKDLGKSWTAVDKAIKAHKPAGTGPATTE